MDEFINNELNLFKRFKWMTKIILGEGGTYEC